MSTLVIIYSEVDGESFASALSEKIAVEFPAGSFFMDTAADAADGAPALILVLTPDALTSGLAVTSAAKVAPDAVIIPILTTALPIPKSLAFYSSINFRDDLGVKGNTSAWATLQNILAELFARFNKSAKPPQAFPEPEAQDSDDVFRGIPDGMMREESEDRIEQPRRAVAPPAVVPRPTRASISPPSPPPSVPAPIMPARPITPPAAPGSSVAIPGAAAAANSATPVQFSAYTPREVKPNDWAMMRAYLYRDNAARAVENDVQRELGSLLSAFRRAVQPARARIEEGTLVTATPILPGFQFNPPSVSIAFFEDWHRFDFKLRANTASLDQAANGMLTFTVEGVIAADIPLSVFVTNAPSGTATASSSTKPYSAIFCSYSHADTPIVARVERAYKILGMDYLRDVVTLKSGQDWNAELLNLIDRADIFQLFWSKRASESKYVRQEWEYALAKMQREQIPSFIRPVYWEEPMPAPAPNLGHLHFAFDATLDDDIKPD